MRILYIDIDSLRPDHLGCYGYHRATSPNIDRIASQGVRFDNCYVSDAPCLPSRTALYTGMFGLHTGVVGHGGTAADLRIMGAGRDFKDRIEMTALPSVLQKGGWHTAMVSSFGQRHAARHFYAGFNEIYNPGHMGMDSVGDVLPPALQWLETNASRDQWYLHVNFWDPHTPYRWPESYGNRFADSPLPEWLTNDVFAGHLKATGPHTALDLNMYDDHVDPKYPMHQGALRNMDELKRHIDHYDTAIHHVDDAVGQLLAVLEKAGVLEDTAIIISADHAENQGELGIYGEHATADQGTCHIPLIIRWPGAQRGTSDDALHYHLDLAPTMAGLLGLETPQNWDGASYADTVLSGEKHGREYLVLSQCAHVCQRSVRFDDYLYVRTYHDGFHLFPKEMLFDIRNDPFEQHDLAEKSRPVCREALAHLCDWQQDLMTRRKIEIDPLWTVMKEEGPAHARPEHLKNYIPQLKATGRAEAAKLLEEKYPFKK